MEEQILEFLDGNMAPHEEEELLHRLAVSPERRALLRQHLQVREMVGNLAKKQRLAVPVALTAGVFKAVSDLGYTGPAPMPNAAQTQPEVVPVAASTSRMFFSMRGRTIASIAVACLLAGSAITYYLIGANTTSGALDRAPQVATLSSSGVASVTTNAPAGAAVALPTVGSNSNTVSALRSGSAHMNSVGRPAKLARLSHASGTSSTENQEAVSTPVLVADKPASDVPTNPAVNTAVRSPEQTSVTPPSVPSQPSNDIRDPETSQRKANPLDGKTLTGGNAETLRPFQFSVRTGGGKWPGSEQGFTGSLAEVRGSYFLTNWLSVTGTLGLFTPSETGVDSVGLEADGSIDLGMKPHLQYRTIAGIELGTHFSVLSMPIDLSFGGATDFSGMLMPRASLFTSVDLQENLLLRVGVEGMGYSNNKINGALSAAQAKYAKMHSLLIGTVKSSEIDGFIGPSIELSWRF